MALDPQLEAFTKALASARRAAGMTQSDLAKAVGYSQPMVSAWEKGEKWPAPAQVFAIERALGAPPGALSIHFGFLPPAAVEHVADLESAIWADPYLDEGQRDVMLGAYQAAKARFESGRVGENARHAPRRATGGSRGTRKSR